MAPSRCLMLIAFHIVSPGLGISPFLNGHRAMPYCFIPGTGAPE